MFDFTSPLPETAPWVFVWSREAERLYLQNGAMEEEREQLHQVVVHVALFLLHADDVGGVEGFGSVQLYALVKWKEAELEEVLDHYGDLRGENEENQTKAGYVTFY